MSTTTSTAGVTPTPVHQADFKFDGGDVEITLKDGDTAFTGMVCSQSMSLASPIWKKFIFPPWKVIPEERAGDECQVGEDFRSKDFQAGKDDIKGGEHVVPKDHGRGVASFSFLEKKKSSKEGDGKTDIIATIDFSEDDCSALLILLNITHLRLTRIPKLLDAETLSRVALLCEQYQCIKITAPWATDGAWFSASKKMEEANFGAMLWAYWAFGKKDDFTRTAITWSKIVAIRGSQDGAEKNTHPEDRLPPGTKECILAGRAKLLQNLLAVPYTLLGNFANAQTRPDGPHYHICPLPSCEAMLCGSLVIGLQRQGLWPRTLTTKLTMSPVNLARQIELIVLLHYPLVQHEHGNTTSHVKCMEKCEFGKDLDRVLKEMPSPLLDSHKRHIETQAKALQQE